MPQVSWKPTVACAATDMKLFITILALGAVAMAQQDLAKEDQELDRLLNEGNNQFTAKMFNEVVKENPQKSVVLSAFSVLTPLAQLSLASDGASHDELLRAIGLPNDNTTKAVFSRVNNKLRSVQGIELKQASKIYVAKDAELNPEFEKTTAEVFNSEVKKVDFTKNTDTAKEINKWVEDQTNNRIKDLVSPDDMDAMTRSILVNAIYFKGLWASPFNANLTKEEDFHVSKDKTTKVQMMHITDDFRYADSTELNAQLLELPYKGREATFLVILPREIDGLEALEEKLKDPTILEKETSRMYSHEVTVSLPKFKIETKTDLKEILEKIDVKRIFSAQDAQLTRLLKNENNLFVSKAIQKAFIEVNEEGAEAAAANEAKFLPGLPLPPPYVIQFVANKPFYYALKVASTTLVTGNFMQ